MTEESKKKDEKPLFSEVFYRSEKKFIEKKTKELIRDNSLMLFGGSLLTLVLIIGLWISGSFFTLIGILLTLACFAWITWILWLHFNTLKTSLTYIVITKDGVKIIVGNKKVKDYIPKENIQKIVINLKKKRIEIHLKDGNVIYSKRHNKRQIEHRILSYDQFERFKKAMKEIGVEYEVIYA